MWYWNSLGQYVALFLLIQFAISFCHLKKLFVLEEKGLALCCFIKTDIANNMLLVQTWTTCNYVSADSGCNKLFSLKKMFVLDQKGLA
jgi:hypothetical protein